MCRMHPAQKAGFTFLAVVTLLMIIVIPYWAIQGNMSHTVSAIVIGGFCLVLAREFQNADPELFTPE